MTNDLDTLNPGCSSTRRRVARWVCGALSAAILATACSSATPSADSTPTTAYPNPPKAAPTPVTIGVDQATTVDLGGGAHLIIPPGAMQQGATVRAKYDTPPEGEWGTLTPTAHPVELISDPPNAIHGVLTLEFPIPTTEQDSDTKSFGISTYNPKSRRWVSVPSTIDTARQMVVAQISHFSWWNPFSWDWAAVGARINQRVGEIIGKRAAAPECTRHQPVPSWATALAGVTTDPAIAIRACAEGEGDVLAIEIRNNRPYSMYLHYGSAVKWGWHEAGDSGLDKLRNALGDRFAGPGELYLPPKGRASVGVLKTVGYKAFSAGFGWRAFAVDAFADVLGDKIGKIVGAGDCLNGLFNTPFGDVSPGVIRDGVAALFDCVKTEAAARGYFDGATIAELEAFTKALNVVGVAIMVADIEWDLLDLYVDGVVIADSGLGAGFAFAGRADPVADPTPPATSPPTTRPTGSTTPTPTAPPATTPQTSPPTSPPTTAPATYAETAGGVVHTWTNYSNAGGYEGPSIARYATVQIACKLRGFAVQNGNTWWYRIAQSPWNNAYYASADAFYNNGQTSGSLVGTPYFDPNVPDC